jgi:hypothetical protein
VLTGGFACWHFRVKREGSRASQRSTCNQHPDCNTPLPVRPSPLLKQRQLKLPIRVMEASQKAGIFEGLTEEEVHNN